MFSIIVTLYISGVNMEISYSATNRDIWTRTIA